jgi:hypothetical protein
LHGALAFWATSPTVAPENELTSMMTSPTATPAQAGWVVALARCVRQPCAYCDSNQYTGTQAPRATMYEIRQLEIPASFTELYSRNGRALESREFVETRFEACDDLARSVSEFCMTLAFKDDLCEETALQRCHAGLLLTPDSVSSREAAWVTYRAAEILQWDQPMLLPGRGPAAPTRAEMRRRR